MDGDTSGGLAPIAGVDKHFIRSWLKWAEQALDYPSLRHVNSMQPTAELRPPDQNQRDEDDLMPYDIMVEIERLAIGKYKSPQETLDALAGKLTIPRKELLHHVKKFYTLWSRNQWKRERIAPSFHLDDFNIDPRTWYRFPILSGAFKHEIENIH
jgi:NAD+ synthase (glutamine-hydrolysing)